MKVTGLFFWAAGMALSAAHAATGAAAETNWYAEVETEAGSFTIALDWEEAPNGCGAFAALAEGLADWVNPQSGRAEKGVPYHPGTSMSWVPWDETEEVVALGNRGRVFTGADGETNAANGSGLTLEDDIRDGGGRSLPARSVAMMNAAGPDTLDGRWAVLLKDADAYYGGRWSRIGTVVGNWDVVESIAGRTRDAATGMLVSPVEVTGVRVWSDPPEALEAWRAGATNWPACGYGDAALEVEGTAGTLRCGWGPKSQCAVVHCGDLTAASKDVVWMDWNEGAEEAWMELPFQASEEGATPFGQRHFCAVAEVEYPELAGPEFPGEGYGLWVEWQGGDGTRAHYLFELDWSSGTGMAWTETETGWTNYATVIFADQWRAGARSRSAMAVMPMRLGPLQLYFLHTYQLGMAGAGGKGRFQVIFRQCLDPSSDLYPPQEIWGDYRWVRLEDELGADWKRRTARRRGGGRNVECSGADAWRKASGWEGKRRVTSDERRVTREEEE